ncbi:MAG: zinc ribbon domain-containing protein [Candidatus Thorarchaeota archaeon]|nr:zinc ribbon domain-containing protein [Candidatus Thorarchaeota archaeon]
MPAIKNDLFLCMGGILIGGGIIMLAVLFSDSPTSYLFIFPFLFVGNLGQIGVFFIAVSIAMIGFYIWQMWRFSSFFEDYNPNTQSQMQDGECFKCKSNLPPDAEYCPKCGTRINENTAD